MSTTWFISGAGRGIGLGLVTSLLSRPSTTVIATTRNGKPTDGLAKIAPATGSKLILLPLEVDSPTDALDAVKILRQEHKIDHLDVVWANAGIANASLSLVDGPVEDLASIINTNTLGPIRLLQATLPLLRAAKQPKFVITSSVVGSIELAHQMVLTPPGYGASKAAINYLSRRLSAEEQGLIVVALHPGLVDTEMGAPLSKRANIPAISVEESVKGTLKIVDSATKETNKKLLDYDSSELPW